MLAGIRARTDQKNSAGVYTFSDVVFGPSKDYPKTFIARNTALLDAVGKAIEDLTAQSSTVNIFPWEQPDIAKLVIVLTDGEENASRFYGGKKNPNQYVYSGKHDLAAIIEKKQKEGDWTFAFQLPMGAADRFSKAWGIPRENCTEWENTKQGLDKVSDWTEQGTVSYFATRSAGGKSTSSFYKATTDLSAVKPKDLKSLDNLTDRFHAYTVDKESDIKTFVESRTRKSYIPGTAYFLLSKPEKVSANKQVVIQKKGNKTLYGGQEARTLIGLVPFKDAKVTPGNHADYDIFVQSTSSNRILVRGSKILVLKG
jgi:hypothetical protein